VRPLPQGGAGLGWLHAVAACQTGRERKARHDALVDDLARFVRDAGYAVSVDRAVRYDVANPKRPGDILVTRYNANRDAALDVTVVSPLQQNVLQQATVDSAAPLARAEEAKRRKYDEECRLHGVTFVPMAVTTYGGWSNLAIATIDRFVRQAAREQNIPVFWMNRRVYGRLAVTIARRNAQALIARCPRREYFNVEPEGQRLPDI